MTEQHEDDLRRLDDFEAEPTKGKNRALKGALVFIGAAVVLGGAYVGAAYYFQDKVPSGTSVQGVEIGGMTRDQAVQTLETELGGRNTTPFTVTVEEATAEINPADSGLAFDAAATVDPLTSLSFHPMRLWQHVTGGGTVEPEFAIDDEALTARMEAVIPSLEIQAEDGAIVFENGAPSVTEPVDGVSVDAEAARETIVNEWFTAEAPLELAHTVTPPDIDAEDISTAMDTIVTPLLSGPVHVQVETITQDVPADVIAANATILAEDGTLSLQLDGEALVDWLVEQNSEFSSTGKDAQIVIQDGAPTIIPSETGEGLAPEDVATGIAEAAVTDTRSALIARSDAEAEFTTEDAEALGVIEEISVFSTPLTADSVRTQNLIVGTEVISNTLLLPGEQFSLIEALGPITLDRGFVSSGVVENGNVSTALGGGLSQLSTTTYNAAYFAGMDIAEPENYHKPHSRYFSRYPEGREATMWGPSVDMTFTNSTPYGVLVQAFVEDGQVWVRFWSTKYYEVESWTSERYNLTSPGTVYNTRADCTPESGGSGGFSVHGERTRSLNGEVVDTYEWAWTYQPWNRVVCGSPTPPPAPAAPEAPAEAPAEGEGEG